ncbi:hypothetical protein [Roseospira visakhapatnamensis]|uniref:Uncharacterized protein n=1 Tax=Roseospira visakhapatnamensis TaxID=390880 RepID=A0A7W6RDK4_9PROT|nr:hypothetical protein [Roseospira visakhapatnamensis]MBB4266086.1 hypothetical protein [Roseospira visakhapatnamensis]
MTPAWGLVLAMGVGAVLPAPPAAAQSTPMTSVMADDDGAVPDDTPAEVITVSEVEALACAAKLEPMVATYQEPTESMYLQRVGDGVLQVWAPREAGPSAPFRPWCVTSVKAIAGMTFLNPANRAVVMEVLAASSTAPPPRREGPPDAGPPPTVIVEQEVEDDEDAASLPAAFQRLPPLGGRSAAEVGVPVPAVLLSSWSPPEPLAALISVCGDEGGQVTAVYDRLTAALMRTECRHADGTATPLEPLSDRLGAPAPASADVARER